MYFSAHNIETEAAPVDQGGYVRGKNYYCGILCYRIPGQVICKPFFQFVFEALMTYMLVRLELLHSNASANASSGRIMNFMIKLFLVNHNDLWMTAMIHLYIFITFSYNQNLRMGKHRNSKCSQILYNLFIRRYGFEQGSGIRY